MPPLPERLRGSPLLVVSSLMFAVMALCARSVAGRLSVGQVVCARFAIGLVFLAFYFPLIGRRPRMGRPGLWALRGIFGGGAVYFYFMAIDRLAVGPATLLNACWPICAAILGIFILKEQVNGYLASGLVATTLGAGLVIWSAVQGGMSLTLGAWAALLLGEPLHPLSLVGSLVCMGGVLWGTGLVSRLLVPDSRPSS
ncbi:DMT family transporter [Archangium violaceum]|uniref:DMT family transporter n=1 Tax=Archangium violaceum TaxID=83451 RepID=UPI00193B9B62|nr:DMT family transporter [Archangium violaceum]QRK08016.1 DMT family transporter [Archangium violaceum]